MSKVGSWSTTAGSNNATPPDGWPEGQAPSTVNDCAREMMAAIRTVWNDAQFFDPNLTPTYASATTFTVAGDQTSAIHAGRRLKLFDATAGVATVLYATVVTASFTAVTTIQVTNDAGQLTSSLSSFAISILSRNNDAIPRDLTASAASALYATITDPVSISAVEIYAAQIFPPTPLKGNTYNFDFWCSEAGSVSSGQVTLAKIRYQPASGVSFPIATLSIGARNNFEFIHFQGVVNIQSAGATGLCYASIVAQRFSSLGGTAPAAQIAIGTAVQTVIDTTNFSALGFSHILGSGSGLVSTFYAGFIERKGPLK